MKPTFKQDLIQLLRQLEDEENSADQLWTWLPSHAAAERHHGDYASEHRPSVSDVLTEAAMYFARLKEPDRPLTLEESEWFESCPCGESHDSEKSDA